MSETCIEEVWRGETWNPRREPCGREIKKAGLCEQHLIHQICRERDIAWREEWARRAVAAGERCRQLAHRLGVDLKPDLTHEGDGARLSFTDLEALADRLEKK